MLNHVFVRRSYLPLLSSGVDRITEELVDHSCLLLLHYQIVLLVFLSNEVVGLAMLVVALGVDFW